MQVSSAGDRTEYVNDSLSTRDVLHMPVHNNGIESASESF